MKITIINSMIGLLLTSSAFADGMSSSVGITNNYVARGTAQTYSNIPSLQLNANYDYKGFYIGAFTANVDFGENQINMQKNPTNQEISAWCGYRHTIKNVLIDYMFGSYNYLGDTFTPLDMIEGKVAVTIPLNEQFSITSTCGYTPDYFNILGKSVWVDSSISYVFNKKITFSGGAGSQIIFSDGGTSAMPYNEKGYSYITWNMGMTYTINANWSIDVRYCNTDRPDLGSVFERNPYGQNYSVTLKYNF